MLEFFVYSLYRDTNGRSPINRARFTAVASWRWLFELVPVRFREIIRA